MSPMNAKNGELGMPALRRLLSALAVVVIAVGASVLPATPAAAETYVVNCYSNPEGTGPILFADATITITADGPTDPVSPGETFSLTNLTVIMIPGGSTGESAFMTVLGQQINLGLSINNDDGNMQWGPMTRTLTAPTEFGVHDIVPEGNFHRISPNGFNFYCPISGDPFAQVEVADVAPTTTTTTTTIPTNGNGNGDNGDGNGDDNGPNGGADPEAEAEREARAQEEARAQAEREAAAAAAERAAVALATPRFTG